LIASSLNKGNVEVEIPGVFINCGSSWRIGYNTEELAKKLWSIKLREEI
jgi:Fe-S oxidoreductase